MHSARLIFTLSFLAVWSISAPAAILSYDVQSTEVVNCTGSPHGLWTAGSPVSGAGTCRQFSDIDGTFTVDAVAATASLIAIAVNPFGLVADIALWFGDFAESHSVYKQEGGVPYVQADDTGAGVNPAPDNSDIDFFLEVFGAITFGGTDVFIINELKDGHGLQYGLGANAKSQTEFDGSAWIQSVGVGTPLGADHWDLNLTFVPVPEPASLGLVAFALAALVGSRRRRGC